MSTTLSHPPLVPLESPPPARGRWSALGFLALAQFLVVLDASIVNIALPEIGAHLGMGTGDLPWVITAYVLAFGGLLLLGGRLGDRYGHRRLFLVGTGAFVLASAVAGLSPTSGILLGARAAQGGSAAMLAPAALALVTRLFPAAADRTKALGIWGAVAGIGSAAGVLLGGVLTAALGWQAIFFVNIPVGVIAVLGTARLVARDAATVRERLDLPGATLITGALVAAVGALSALEQRGPASPLTLGLGATAIALAAAFVAVERRTALPLVPLTLFRNRRLSSGNAITLLLGAGMVALFFALSVFLQAVLGYNALAAGLSQLPLAGALVLTAGLVPAAVVRLGSKRTLIGALLILAAGLVWLAAAPSTAVFATAVLGPTIVIGVGLGGAAVAATQLAVEDVPDRDAGLAGGLVNTSQQVGGALGLAVLSSVATARTGALEARGLDAATALTGGFSWVFLGAAALALVAAVVRLLLRDRTDGR
ncbi:MFS transporter [Amnibacterium kyonggiense]|uniref:EmrB/QacA subfamily drug resistance transporter n=1 Tax=Amnibacterium kyonggiense TaxID=595671 RepID=A0A4R7FR85_9MICO|nr:MFS transporter [Amnibacterium kyonggiense]TDS80317.1 EmrB/QacA subfamily drug resistance transporter [Amnibacterium kyonggiense]